VNPESATSEFLNAALEGGLNRISIGLQSLNDTELMSVGRIHSAQQAIGAIKLAEAVGFRNISCDLIIGLPGQTWRSLKHSISRLLALKVQHLSVYCLSLELDTPLGENPPSNLPSDDRQVELFEKTRRVLLENGFEHYEISNFALPGYESRHNSNYWQGGEYLGLGPAAASHLECIRFKNKPCLDAYLKKPTRQTTEVEQLGIIKKAQEEAVLRLRLLNEGIHLREFTKKYKQDIIFQLLENLEEITARGELIFDGTKYTLNPVYIMTSNRVFAQLFS
jgi:oxygen-independent coproporphyrinogen-3 oxidase